MSTPYHIITFNKLNKDQKNIFLEQIKEIFFMSSDKKTFLNDEDKANFFKKWCGDYIELFPEYVFLAIRNETELLGYLTGVDDTLSALDVLKVPGLKVFEDLYQEYPAHLHINAHEKSRGLGVGSELVLSFEKILREKKVVGLHLITSENARNTSFYKKNGFLYHELRKLNSYELFFMGKQLNA